MKMRVDMRCSRGGGLASGVASGYLYGADGRKQEGEAMSTNSELLERRNNAVPRGVASATAVFAARAENAEVWDVEGKRYIDFAGGIGVLNTGHRHPKVMKAIEAQLERFTHPCFQVTPYEPYIELAEKLNKLAPSKGPNKTIFLTTGAEAIENAVKIARNAKI